MKIPCTSSQIPNAPSHVKIHHPKKEIRQWKHQVHQLHHMFIYHSKYHILLKVSLCRFVVRQVLSRIYAFFGVCTIYRSRNCAGVLKMTNKRYGNKPLDALDGLNLIQIYSFVPDLSGMSHSGLNAASNQNHFSR